MTLAMSTSLKPSMWIVILLAWCLVAAPGPLDGQPRGRASDFEDLLRGLTAADPRTRLATIEALGELTDPRALAPLVALLTDPAVEGQARMAAASALAALGDRRAVPPLIAELQRDMRVRTGLWAALIPALGTLGDPRAVPVLVQALENRDEDWLGREMAAQALGEIGAPQACGALIAAAWAADTRVAAITALGRLGEPRAVEVFLWALDEGEEPKVRAAAREGLRTLGVDAVPGLLRALNDFSREAPRTALRARVAQVLGNIGDARALPALERATRDPSPRVRASARFALAQMARRCRGDCR